MNTRLLLIYWLPWYIGPTALGCLLLRRWRRWNMPLMVSDWLLFFIPALVWLAGMVVTTQIKSLGNLAELYILAIVAMALHFVTIQKAPAAGGIRSRSIAVLLVTSAIGFALALLLPALPE